MEFIDSDIQQVEDMRNNPRNKELVKMLQTNRKEHKHIIIITPNNNK